MKKIRSYYIIGYLFTAAAGTLFHFVYDWTGQGAAAALFFPVNESTWEHMKLVFFPMLLYTFLTYSKINRDFPAAPAALLLGGIIGTWTIPVLFYTYTGILGRNFTAADIGVFFLALFAAFCTAWKLRESQKILQYRYLIFLLTAISAVLFFLFAFFPPGIGLFREP